MLERIKAWLSRKLVADATPEEDVCQSCNVDCTDSIKAACEMRRCAGGESIGPGGGLRVGGQTGRKVRRT